MNWFVGALTITPYHMDTNSVTGLRPRRNNNKLDLEVLDGFLIGFNELDEILVEGKGTLEVETFAESYYNWNIEENVFTSGST